ncbi:MAG: hypothetical protein G01um101448_556 [Parcubacteria group bacterium Gr01-1014_48]|nr:MAG: hypothetical protein Greene041614_840 [Parcubacteria group bacterium Greene0416_14]TSC73784.1 MAG: hypothetical protein G01um101448_556 [Parcubacteria group bacterium Gr01-1014_48]TSD00651.1 MAG: hypothetical protein Greene101415_754 [Parcubacteria group bacterium Greene1014_15]TSD08087.1 MAG: hypothetical protein Greene07144_437 [Parcubacteria group bacterium Greene0714_4]
MRAILERMEREPKNVIVTITTDTMMRILLLLLLIAGVYFFWDLVLIILMAVVIASAAEPAIAWFRRFGIPRVIAVLTIYLSFIVGFAVLLFFFIPQVLDDAASFLSTVPSYIDANIILGPLRDHSPSILQPGIDGLANGFSITELVENLRTTFSQTGTGIFKVVGAIFGSIVSMVLIVVLSFYLAVQDDGVVNFLGVVTPLQHKKYVVDLWRRSQIKIGRWMQGQIILGFLVGLIVYLLLTIFSVEHALLLAVLSAVFEIIPVFGPILAAIPAVIVAFISGMAYIPEGGINAALVVAGFYVLVQQFENHLIYPLVVRKVVGVPPMLVILALLIGARLAGFLGVMLSVPIAAALFEYIGDVERRKMAEEDALEKVT